MFDAEMPIWCLLDLGHLKTRLISTTLLHIVIPPTTKTTTHQHQRWSVAALVFFYIDRVVISNDLMHSAAWNSGACDIDLRGDDSALFRGL